MNNKEENNLSVTQEYDIKKANIQTKYDLFLQLANPDSNGVSRWVDTDEFVNEFSVLRFGNGASWARKESALSRKYNIEFLRKEGKIKSIRLNGYSDIKKQNNLAAYDGTEPYIFVSYSHGDKKSVYSIIDKFQKSGYRVWFDEGIKHGDDWRAFIENKIESCECFIAMISKGFFDSKWCPRELKYADENNKKISCIYLENVEIPKGKGMGIIVSDAQATKKYEYNDKNTFYNKILAWDAIERCKDKPQDVIKVKDEFMRWIIETKMFTESVSEVALCEFEKLIRYINAKENVNICIREFHDLKNNEEVILKYINCEDIDDKNFKQIHVKLCGIAYVWLTNFFNMRKK